jgi:hypothetical protein
MIMHGEAMALMVVHYSQSVYKKTTPNYLNDRGYTRCNDCRKKKVNFLGWCLPTRN